MAVDAGRIIRYVKSYRGSLRSLVVRIVRTGFVVR